MEPDDEVAGIVVRYEGERGFRFHSAGKAYDALDGHVFVTPAAAQRAARDFASTRARRPASHRCEARHERLRDSAAFAALRSASPARWVSAGRRIAGERPGLASD